MWTLNVKLVHVSMTQLTAPFSNERHCIDWCSLSLALKARIEWQPSAWCLWGQSQKHCGVIWVHFSLCCLAKTNNFTEVQTCCVVMASELKFGENWKIFHIVHYFYPEGNWNIGTKLQYFLKNIFPPALSLCIYPMFSFSKRKKRKLSDDKQQKSTSDTF